MVTIDGQMRITFVKKLFRCEYITGVYFCYKGCYQCNIYQEKIFLKNSLHREKV